MLLDIYSGIIRIFFSFNLFISLTIIWHQLNNQLTQYQGIFIKIIYQGKVIHILQLWMGTTSGSIMLKDWRSRFRFSNDLILKSLNILSCLYSTSLKPLMGCINFNSILLYRTYSGFPNTAPGLLNYKGPQLYSTLQNSKSFFFSPLSACVHLSIQIAYKLNNAR